MHANLILSGFPGQIRQSFFQPLFSKICVIFCAGAFAVDETCFPAAKGDFGQIVAAYLSHANERFHQIYFKNAHRFIRVSELTHVEYHGTRHITIKESTCMSDLTEHVTMECDLFCQHSSESGKVHENKLDELTTVEMFTNVQKNLQIASIHH